MNDEYVSILYTKKPSMQNYVRNFEPNFFLDLNLNQVVDSIMSERGCYNLQPYFYLLPNDKETIYYRQDVLKDVSTNLNIADLTHFSNLIRNAIEYEEYCKKCDHPLSKQRWYVDFVTSYCEAVRFLMSIFSSADIKSTGLIKFYDHLKKIVNNDIFLYAEKECLIIKDKFKNLRYGLVIEQDKVVVTINPKAKDYCKSLEDIFYMHGSTASTTMENPLSGAFMLSNLEQDILEILIRENPEPFNMLKEFCKMVNDIADEVILRFENEIQFYIAYCLYRNRLEEYGYKFAYPHITDNSFQVQGAYDLALADKNISLKKPVVVNDAYLAENERFFVITGPNQGGKTTFARALGQIVYFSLLGLTAPCDEASIPMFSGLATHFSVEESAESGRGKLKDELIRLRSLHESNTKRYFVVLNELFTTAATYDSYLMGIKALDYFAENDCLGVYVTHIKELAENYKGSASLVAELSDKDKHVRTYKITRRPPDGIGYAESIAEKYGMSYSQMKEVLKHQGMSSSKGSRRSENVN